MLILLEEMGVPYKKVPIYPERKPTWFPLLNAEGQVPVLVHEGQLIEDSRQIVAYLLNKFPDKAKKICSTDTLRLTGGTAQFTRFYYAFQSWLSGAYDVTETKVDEELHKLKQMKKLEQYPALKVYLDACFEMPSFKKTKSSEESILKGYARLVSAGPERAVRLPDLVE